MPKIKLRRGRTALILWLAIVITALATGRQLLYRLMYLMTAILVLSFLWTIANVYWVRLVRQTRSRRTQVGRLLEERFVVRNTGFLPKLWLELRDASTLPGHRASHVVNSLGPKSYRGWLVRTRCLERGVFRLGPMSLASGDPLGLFRIERHLPATSTILVYPATVGLPSFEPPVGTLPGGDAVRRRAQYITTNVAGIRDYAPGDSFNRIHWPSTARLRRVMVKEFELDPLADLWVILDMEGTIQVGEVDIGGASDTSAGLSAGFDALFGSGYEFELAPTTEEYGVTVAASLCRHFIGLDRTVGLITYGGGGRRLIQADRGERQLNKVLEQLAIVRAAGRVPLEQLLAAEERLFGRNTTIVVITPSTSEEWVHPLRDLGRHGVRTMAVVLDPSTFGNAPSSLGVVSTLIANGIPCYTVACGESLEEALSWWGSSRTANRAPIAAVDSSSL
ncbi:MAG: DUF58 domain-containing protein [Anaerolineae bacterium]